MQSHAKTIFNNQRLLFGATPPVSKAGTTCITEHYYKHGWAVLDNIAMDEFEAIRLQEDFINSIDGSRLALQKRFHSRIQLAKADRIPVCDDVVASNFQILHFDMGHPFLESDGQLLVTHVGIYLPRTTAYKVTARTRLVELQGLLSSKGPSLARMEEKIIEYVSKHGDGWKDNNTYRLACFARFIDALSAQPQLEDQIDKTVGQWFRSEERLEEKSAHEKEVAFYARNGIDLRSVEHEIALEPGQLLILDNARVIHGRIGRRRAKEIFNFMFGIEAASREDITALRQYICSALATKG